MAEFYHTGYYLEPFWTIKERLNNITFEDIMGYKPPDDEEFIYYDAEIFLNGSCQLFSYALMEKLGYSPYKIEDKNHVHYFCQASYQKKRVYIDVRGMTSDFGEFLQSSCISDDEAIVITPQEISNKDLFEIEQDKMWGLPFARAIIERDKTYYSSEN